MPKPDDFGVDLGAARLGVLVLLEHQHAGALAQHEAVAVLVPGPRGGLGIVVARATARAPRRSRRCPAATRWTRRRRRPSRRRRRTRSCAPTVPMACRPVVQAVTTAMFGPLKPYLIDTWPGDHVDDRSRHEERRDAARAAIDQFGVRLPRSSAGRRCPSRCCSRCARPPRGDSASPVGKPLSCTACMAAASPRWMKRSMWRASFSGM